MKHIILVVDDKKGVIADIAARLGKERINIESLSASVIGNRGMITLTVKAKDHPKAVRLLKDAGYNVMSADLILLDLVDEPGVLFQISQTLYESDINIESIHLITKHGDRALYALKVDNTQLARSLLQEHMFKDAFW